MARAFSAMIDLSVDTSRAKATISELGNTKTTIPVQVGTDADRHQAQAMLDLVDRMDRKTVRPRVDGTSIRSAQTQTRSLDKELDRVARTRKVEIKTELSEAASAFGAGGSMARGGVGGVLSGAATLGGMGGAGMAVAGAGMIAATVGTVVHTGLKRAVSKEKLEGFMPRAYGASGAEFIAQAKELSDVTGFLAEDFMQSALIGRQLSANYGLQIDQVAKLVAVSADLAATSPYEDIQTAANAMERLQSAVRGEAEASERLGLTLNDTYMRNMAANGAFRETWGTMSDLEKAQARYNEILVQTQDVLGAAEDEGLAKSLRQAQQRFSDAGTALSEKLLPALSKLVELAAKIPAPAYEAAMWGGLAMGGAMLGRGVFRVGRSIMGGIGGKAITEAASTAAGQAAASAAGAATKSATNVAAQIAAKAGTQAAGDVVGSISGKLVAQSAVSAISTVGGLAAIAAAAALVAWAIKDIAADTDAAYKQAEEADERRVLLQRYTQQREHGIDWGVYRDAEGRYVQGTIQGMDQVVGRGSYYTTQLVDGKPRSMQIAGSQHDINRLGSEVGRPYYGQYADQPKIQVGVTLNNQSTQPLKATDVESYAPSNY